MQIRNANLSNKSIAIGIIAIFALWILSGVVFPTDIDVKKTLGKKNIAVPLETKSINAEERIVEHRFYGQTEANRTVELRSEIKGRITSIMAKEGSTLKKGEVIATIDVQNRQLAVKQAEAVVKQRTIEYKAARSLSKKGLNSQAQSLKTESELRLAEANLALAQLHYDNTRIVAPFDGILNRIHIEQGSLAEDQNSSHIATMYDLNPLIIRADVSEAMVQFVKQGQSANALIRGYGKKNGRIRYISKAADPITRSFAIELEIDNPDHAIPAGVTSTVYLPEQAQSVHVVPSSILTLGEKGDIGLKTLSDDQTVGFFPIKIIQDTPEGLWVKGLPVTANIITKGQNYVKAGMQIKKMEN